MRQHNSLDDRELYVPYYDGAGKLLPLKTREELIALVHKSDLQTKEEILQFCLNAISNSVASASRSQAFLA